MKKYSWRHYLLASPTYSFSAMLGGRDGAIDHSANLLVRNSKSSLCLS